MCSGKTRLAKIDEIVIFLFQKMQLEFKGMCAMQIVAHLGIVIVVGRSLTASATSGAKRNSSGEQLR